MDIGSTLLLSGVVGGIAYSTLRLPFKAVQYYRVRKLKTAMQQVTALQSRGELNEAIATMERWHSRNQNLASNNSLLVGYYTLAGLYTAANRPSDAAPFFRKALPSLERRIGASASETKCAAIAHVYLARHYMQENRDTDVPWHLNRSVALFGKSGEPQKATISSAYLAGYNGDSWTASDLFANALGFRPNSLTRDEILNTYVALMDSLLRDGRDTECLKIVRQLEATWSSDVLGNAVSRRIARTVGRAGDYGAADRLLDDLVRNDQTDEDRALTLQTRCAILMERGQLSTVKELCTAHIVFSENPADVYHLLGSALIALGNYADAESAFLLAREQLTGRTGKLVDYRLAVGELGRARVLFERKEHVAAQQVLSSVRLVCQAHRKADFLNRSLNLVCQSYDRSVSVDDTTVALMELLDELTQVMSRYQNASDYVCHYAVVFAHLTEAFIRLKVPDIAWHFLQKFNTDDFMTPLTAMCLYFWQGRCCEAMGQLHLARQFYGAVLETGCDPDARWMREAGERLRLIDHSAVTRVVSDVQ